MKNRKYKISVIGLGYVGLPLAIEFSKEYFTVGFDINKSRIQELLNFNDKTKEVTEKQIKDSIKSKRLVLTSLEKDIESSNIKIITVPTPIDKNKKPDLNPVLNATELVAKYLKKGDIIIYESTVYPGVTEEICVPLIEKKSGLNFNSGFYVGYSPERINPGDKKRTLRKIIKVTSGSTNEIAIEIDNIYKKIIDAGTYMAPSIKVAEAAKVIENSQRDINIAFMNELAKIFSLLNIDTSEVLKAAATKWNFLNFSPGLVGGHCIGVDPYYLTSKALELGYNPEIILSGRKINDSMGSYVASELLKCMIDKKIKIESSHILILGFTFKENCPDVRNTRVIDVYNYLIKQTKNIFVYDPYADKQDVYNEYGINIIDKINDKKYDSIILCVAHKDFKSLDIKKLRKNNSVLYDVKSFLNIECDKKL